MTVEDWVEAYGRAWRERDADSAAGLFTEDAEYRYSPFREPVVGSKAIHAYWEDVTSAQKEVDVRIGTPVVSSDLVVAEWWATMLEDGEETTITGCLLLRFTADGRCTAFREYWFQKPGRRDPHPGWGE